MHTAAPRTRRLRRLGSVLAVAILTLSLLATPPAAAVSSPATSTVIEANASLSSLVHGQSVVIRYTVTSDDTPLAGTPTTVRYGGKTLAVTTDAAGRGALNIRDLPVGRAAVIIRYAGDGAHAASSTTLTFTVSPRPTAITELTPTAGTTVAGNSLTVRFLVSGAGKPLVGVRTAITVDGTTVWARTGADGRVARTVPILPVGRATVQVRYSGDAAHAGASAATTVIANNPCPPTAKACIDLANNVTWIQSQGAPVYGPVPITSGRPGHRTRTGTFRVYWKDKNHKSSLFNGAPMPNSIFFDGGIAFHQGSLSIPSHGCIHLSAAASQEYWNRLRTGDVVYVWGTAPY